MTGKRPSLAESMRQAARPEPDAPSSPPPPAPLVPERLGRLDLFAGSMQRPGQARRRSPPHSIPPCTSSSRASPSSGTPQPRRCLQKRSQTYSGSTAKGRVGEGESRERSDGSRWSGQGRAGVVPRPYAADTPGLIERAAAMAAIFEDAAERAIGAAARAGGHDVAASQRVFGSGTPGRGRPFSPYGREREARGGLQGLA